MYVLFNETELIPEYNASCGNTIYKLITDIFTYNFNLNNLVGDIIINYEIISGEVDIDVDYDGVVTEAHGLVSTGSITINRDDITKLIAVITVTPITETAVVQITNVCPIGIPLKLIQITLCDVDDLGKTITNRHSWGASSLYSKNILFETYEINNFSIEEGIEGVGKFPLNGSTVNLQSFKSNLNTGSFLSDFGNVIGYLVTDEVYDESDIETILSEATYIETTQTALGSESTVDFGSFVFTRPTLLDNLYLIWDYRNVSINSDTNIIIYFDSSGSMNSTLAPLTEMKDTLLMNTLLPLYNYDETLYNSKVQVISESSERTIHMLNILGATPDGNTIVMVFQDETSNYVSGTICPQLGNYASDLSAFRSRLDGFAPNYYRSVVFQVATSDTGEYLLFKNMLEALENGDTCYAGTNGLSDKTEIKYKYNITPASTAEYYMNQVVAVLSEFGIDI
jgi:hypothetical protein